MSAAKEQYIRIYFKVREDPRFEHAYGCDTCWAAYSRLLMDAEGAFPSPASLPFGLDQHAHDQLAADGIIELRPHGTFIVHGLAAEREKRAAAGKAGAAARWNMPPLPDPESEGNATASDDAMPSQYLGNAEAMRRQSDTNARRDETRRDEQRQDAQNARANGNGHFGGASDDLQSLLAGWRVLGIPLSPKESVRLDRLVEVHGADAVRGQLERIHEDPKCTTSRQYVLGAENALNQIPTGPSSREAAQKAAEAERAKRREQQTRAILDDFGETR